MKSTASITNFRIARLMRVPPATFAIGLLLAIFGSTAIYADGQWQPQDGAQGKPQFIVPPGEDPNAHDPAHWGLVNKQTMPARIPSLEKPTTNMLGPRADHEHQTAIGKYQPFEEKAKGFNLRRNRDQVQYQIDATEPNPWDAHSGERYPGFATPGETRWPATCLECEQSSGQSQVQNSQHYAAPSAAPAYGNGYMVEQPLPPGVEPRLPFLRMSEEEAAYQASPYHVKEKNPPLGEILKTGAYFASYQAAFLEPHFQGNTAITFDRPTRGFSRDFDFGMEYASKWTIGFESLKGPAAKLTYLEMFANSETVIGRSDGVQTATASIFLTGPQRTTFLTASNPGERIEARHRFWIKDTSALLFKEIKMPVSRLNGLLGFRYLNIHHTMHAELLNPANTQLGVLHGTHYFRGLGPTIGMEYFRPIGHTQFEFLGGATTTLLFGNRDQVAYNTATADFTRFGADELISLTEAKLGGQWVREWGRRYRIFARGTINAQSFYGGGTSSNPIGNFGLFGVAFAAGLNH